jgi:hypothetical protein
VPAADTQPLVSGSNSSLVADVIVTCSPAPNEGAAVTVDLQAFYSAPVVSNPVGGDFVDSLLLINEPAAVVIGTNAFYAMQPELNKLQWDGIALSIQPGQTATLRLTNVHVDTLYTLANEPPGAFPPGVTAQIAVIAEAAPGLLNPAVVVALVDRDAPDAPAPSPVPEPATVAQVALGAVTAAGVKILRKRKRCRVNSNVG